MNTTITLSRGSAIMIIAFAIGAVLNFAFAVSMGWLLTPAEYGMLGVAQGLIAIVGLFIGAAFPWVVTKFLAEPGRQDKATIFKSSMIPNIGLAFLLSLLLYLGYEFAWLPLGNEYQPLITVVIILILVTSVSSIYQGSLQGLLRFKQLGIVRCISPTIVLVSSVSLVLFGFGAPGAMTGYIVAALIALIFCLYYTRDQKFWQRSSWTSKEVYSFALPMFLGIMGAQFLINVDILGVKFFVPGMSDIMAGYYRASLTISRIPVFFALAIMGVFLPFISHFATNREMVNNYSAKIVKYALIFVLPICLAIFAIPGSLITLIFPQSYIAGAQTLRILSIGMFLLVLSLIYSSVFQGVGKPKVPAIIMLGTIAIQIACLYFLVPRYSLTGAAISTTSACLFSFILLQYVHLRHYGSSFNMRDLGKIALASVVLLLILYFFPMPGRILTVIGLICGLGAFFAILAVAKVLHYTDADILLSGILNNESRVRASVVNLIRVLNREAGDVNP
ncbi:lipid II flippase MurJ [subsurface metagenome]